MTVGPCLFGEYFQVFQNMFWGKKGKLTNWSCFSSLSRLTLKIIVLPVVCGESSSTLHWCLPGSCETNMGFPTPLWAETHSRQAAPALCCSRGSTALFEGPKGNFPPSPCFVFCFCFPEPWRESGTSLDPCASPGRSSGRSSSPHHDPGRKLLSL